MEGNLWLYRLYFRVVILLWLPVSLSAVDLPNLTFRTITISDGLSNNIINTIYKDKRGFIWLSGNFWLVSFKISYLCLPLFHETRTTPSCHPSGCAYRQL